MWHHGRRRASRRPYVAPVRAVGHVAGYPHVVALAVVGFDSRILLIVALPSISRWMSFSITVVIGEQTSACLPITSGAHG